MNPVTTTVTTLQPVTLAGTPYTVEEHVYTWTRADGSTATGVDVFLTGPRGALYILRGFLGHDDGERQVISCTSGAPLRKLGNEVRVVRIGDVLEQIVRPPVIYARR